MFGFGKKKKKMDDKLAGGIGMEMSMYMDWHLDNKERDLTWDEIAMIAEKILIREGIEHGHDEIFFLQGLVFSNTNFEAIKNFREKTNFDNQVSGFCKSIALDKKYYP